MGAVRFHNQAGQLNSILDGDTRSASYTMRSRIQRLAYTADRTLPSVVAWNMWSPTSKPSRRYGLLSYTTKNITSTV